MFLLEGKLKEITHEVKSGKCFPVNISISDLHSNCHIVSISTTERGGLSYTHKGI